MSVGLGRVWTAILTFYNPITFQTICHTGQVMWGGKTKCSLNHIIV